MKKIILPIADFEGIILRSALGNYANYIIRNPLNGYKVGKVYTFNVAGYINVAMKCSSEFCGTFVFTPNCEFHVYQNGDNDQPTICPQCSARTDFLEVKGVQFHNCPKCKYQFILTFDEQ